MPLDIIGEKWAIQYVVLWKLIVCIEQTLYITFTPKLVLGGLQSYMQNENFNLQQKLYIWPSIREEFLMYDLISKKS